MTDTLLRDFILKSDQDSIDSIIETLTKRVQSKLTHNTGKEHFDLYIDELRAINSISKLFRDWKEEFIEELEEFVEDTETKD